MTDGTTKTPVHLWIVGIVSLLWNAGGAFDYTMTETRNAWYLSNFTPEQLEWVAGFPPLMIGFWALGVWGALAGSLLLLFRSRYAFHAFLLGLLGLLVTTIWQYSTPMPAGTLTAFAIGFSVAIWLSQLLLAWYAKAMTKRGVLR